MHKSAKKISLLVVGFMASVSGVALFAACEDPFLYCTTQRGTFAARIEHRSGDEDCLPLAYTFGVITYPGKGEGVPNFGEASVALSDNNVYAHYTAAYKAGLIDDPEEVEQALRGQGAYKSAKPNANDLCDAESFDNAYELPAIEDDPMTEADESTPAISRSYAWSDVQVEISPEVQGAIFWGQLEFEGTVESADGSEPAACKGVYDVKAVWPAIGCSEDANECFCANGEDPGSDDCQPTGMSFDFVGDLECVDGLCVFKDVDRKK
jgi:hypothetical protein